MRIRAGLVAIGLVTAACGNGSDDPGREAAQDLRVVEINGAQLRRDGSLLVNLDVCNADENSVEVTELDHEVRVRARTDGPEEGDECSDGVEVPLDAPLAGRRLVDEATGAEVMVEAEVD